MKVALWAIGKTSFGYLKEGIKVYQQRLRHYLSFEMLIIPDLKNRKKLTFEQIKEREGILILKKLEKGDFLILLDEKGKQYTSVQFSELMEKQAHQSHKRLVFVIGGAYGFSEAVYERANSKISLSKMTFSHQMVRLFFVEQLYRAMTIIKREPYHHE